jgi:glycosyltransferase involved in cell wall biosynthesis
MENIKISIIVPVYNTGKYLKRCLESIISQKFEDIEIIVVNDCSPDDSLNIIKEFMKKDNRISLIDKQRNEGLSAARNSGIKIAKGEYIIHIDSDDWIEKEYFLETYQNAKKYDADIIITDFYKDFDNGKINYIKDQAENINKEDMLENIFLMNAYPSVCNKLIRRELYIKNNIYHPIGVAIGEDLCTTPKLIYYAKNIYKYNKPFLHYIQTPDSMIRTKIRELNKLKEIYFVIKNLEEFFDSKNVNLSLNILKINHLSIWLLKSKYNLKDLEYLEILNEYINTFKKINLNKIKSRKVKVIGRIFKIIDKPFIFISIWYLNRIFECLRNENYENK